MNNSYTIKEAQRNFVSVVRAAERRQIGTITRHQKPVAYVISPTRLNEILETMEILCDSKAAKAIRIAKTGRGKAIPAKDLPT